jgi:hypothetical protein
MARIIISPIPFAQLGNSVGLSGTPYYGLITPRTLFSRDPGNFQIVFYIGHRQNLRINMAMVN